MESPVSGTIDGRSELDAYGIRLGAQRSGPRAGDWGCSAAWQAPCWSAASTSSSRRSTTTQGTILNFADESYQAVPVVDAAAGAAWTYGAWQVAGGYEMTTWFNLAEIERASYDLILDGFFLRLAYAR